MSVGSLEGFPLHVFWTVFLFLHFFRPTLGAKIQSNKNLRPGAVEWKATEEAKACC